MKTQYLILILALFTLFNCNKESTVLLYNQEVAEVNSKLFGHFLEIPSWGGERGVEAAVINREGDLHPQVIEKLSSLKIPILRYPGGIDVDYISWLDKIDNAPGRQAKRPITRPRGGQVVSNLFGYDEYMNLCEDLEIEPLIVGNLGQTVFGGKSTEAGVQDILSLIAYLNAPINNDLPKELQKWPKLRQKNGRSKAWDLNYFQIGNETWSFFDKKLMTNMNIYGREAEIAHYTSQVLAYVQGIKKHFPHIKIIVDSIAEDVDKVLFAELGDSVDYWAKHVYRPWQVSQVVHMHTGKLLDPSILTKKEVWHAFTAIPGDMNEDGMSILINDKVNRAKQHGHKMAFTEWNWNGWWGRDSYYNWTISNGQTAYTTVPSEERQKYSPDMARGIGTASYLHAFMRDADTVKMGFQSMTVGNAWGIAGIKVKLENENSALLRPSAQVVKLYTENHGNRIIKQKTKHLPQISQVYKLNDAPGAGTVSALDIITSKSDTHLFIHILNRHFESDYNLKVQLNAFELSGDSASLISLVQKPNAKDRVKDEEIAHIVENKLELNKNHLELVIPTRSVNVLKVNLHSQQ